MNVEFTEREKLIIKLSMNLALVAMNPSKSEIAKRKVYEFAERHNTPYPLALDILNSIDDYLLEDSSN